MLSFPGGAAGISVVLAESSLAHRLSAHPQKTVLAFVHLQLRGRKICELLGCILGSDLLTSAAEQESSSVPQLMLSWTDHTVALAMCNMTIFMDAPAD